MQKFSSYFSKVVGPSAFMAAGAIGAGSTSSLILAGAWFGYELLWVALFILPLFVIAVDLALREEYF